MVQALADQGLRLAVAESLTGGLVLAALTDVPGSSQAIVGGVVAYDVAVKVSVLGVDAALLERCGPVDPQVASQMARGVRELLDADLGVATTGEAGPDSATGKPVGLFYAALDGATDSHVVSRLVSGDRTRIRDAAVEAALDLVRQAVVGDQASR